MKKVLILATSALSLALASPVFASSGDKDNKPYGSGKYYGPDKSYGPDKNYDTGKYYGSGKVKWLSPAKAKAKASQLGYDVRRIKRDSGYYEIYAFDKNGHAVELYLHPTTGKLIRVERKF
jgi:hypothetical protein